MNKKRTNAKQEKNFDRSNELLKKTFVKKYPILKTYTKNSTFE